MYTQRETDRTTNLLISSNVHYVYLGGDKNVLVAARDASNADKTLVSVFTQIVK